MVGTERLELSFIQLYASCFEDSAITCPLNNIKNGCCFSVLENIFIHMKIRSNEEKIKWLDRIYKGLIIFIVTWILAMEFVNYNYIQNNYKQIKNIIKQHAIIQQNIIDIKSNALNDIIIQNDINTNIMNQLKKSHTQ